MRVLAVGKRRDPQLGPLIDEFVARTRHLIPVAFERVRDTAALFRASKGHTVLLDERGEECTTRELADWLAQQRDCGVGLIDFLVGGAEGFDDAARRRASRTLALSRLTLPHRLAQLFLVEQLYRAGSLLAGHPYHRD
ncbi:MAG: 23S rRNA (pseudouridine(1915)-N(3))-methyltransferase RlmH [Nannocystaceae bacterium]